MPSRQAADLWPGRPGADNPLADWTGNFKQALSLSGIPEVLLVIAGMGAVQAAAG